MSDNHEKNPKVAKGATLGIGSGPESYRSNKERRMVRKKSIGSFPLPIERNDNLDYGVIPKIIAFLEQYGVMIKSYKEKYIARRLKVRMNRLGIQTFAHYLSYLKTHPHEISTLKESFSINVTRFFRNRDTFELIRDYIVPAIAKQTKGEGKTLRIWSAGCAVGAEPYTIAMIFDEEVKRNNIRLQILATDINPELLEIAKYGIYDPSYLSEMTTQEAMQFFNLTPDGNYEVKRSIKAYVTFQQHDLMKDQYPKGFDVIFCRNVLIYIDKEAQKDIITKFIDSLNPNGYLAIGRTETLFGNWKDSLRTISGIHRIYQKTRDLDADQEGVVLPSQIRKQDGKRTLVSKSISKERSKRLNSRMAELANFRQRFEERKNRWEKKMQEMELKRKSLERKHGLRSADAPNKVQPFKLRSSRLGKSKTDQRDVTLDSNRSVQERREFWEKKFQARKERINQLQNQVPLSLKSKIKSKKIGSESS